MSAKKRTKSKWVVKLGGLSWLKDLSDWYPYFTSTTHKPHARVFKALHQAKFALDCVKRHHRCDNGKVVKV